MNLLHSYNHLTKNIIISNKLIYNNHLTKTKMNEKENTQEFHYLIYFNYIKPNKIDTIGNESIITRDEKYVRDKLKDIILNKTGVSQIWIFRRVNKLNSQQKFYFDFYKYYNYCILLGLKETINVCSSRKQGNNCLFIISEKENTFEFEIGGIYGEDVDKVDITKAIKETSRYYSGIYQLFYLYQKDNKLYLYSRYDFEPLEGLIYEKIYNFNNNIDPPPTYEKS